MREILLRAKRKDNGEWITVDILQKREPVEVVLKTVGQYTGLTTNGKKVFEGDIIGCKARNGDPYTIGVVKYGTFNCSCCDGVYGWFIDGGDIRDIEYYEVIGNIHDNPELFGGEFRWPKSD